MALFRVEISTAGYFYTFLQSAVGTIADTKPFYLQHKHICRYSRLWQGMCFTCSWSQFAPKDMRGLFIISLVAALGQGLDLRANSIPAININDSTGPITVTGSGFKSFSSGTIAGNPEAVWWYATSTSSLGNGQNAGIWTEPGSSGISDEFYIVTSGKATYGFFLSDPAVVPTIFTIPGSGVTIDLSKLGFTSSVETGLPTQISPGSALMSVMATSSVPDGGTTVILLGLGIGGLVWFGRRRARKGPGA